VHIREKVYIETSVIGAYFDDREDIGSAFQHLWTHRCWNELLAEYDSVISQAVLDELGNPDYPNSKKAIDLVSNLQKVPIEEEVKRIVRIYIANKLMPSDTVGDALHLALASFHKCDYLLTWNCSHIANPNKFKQIRLLNSEIGLYVPILVTPNQLLGGSDEK